MTILSLAAVAVGNFLYAAAVQLFLVPGQLVTGGTTGMALAANAAWGTPVEQFVLAFNVLMLAVGYLLLGKAFALTTLASTFLYPAALWVCERIFAGVVLTDDILLCTVFSGIGIGAALGLAIRAGASTGGMDIPPLVLRKYFRVPVSVGMYVFDGLILLMQMMFRPVENVLYGIVLVMIYTVVLDRVLIFGAGRTEVRIVSEHTKEIADAILTQLDRGVTILNGEGGYLHEERKMIVSVIANRELPRLEKLIRKLDPESFVVVSSVKEVRGRGFSLEKLYR